MVLQHVTQDVRILLDQQYPNHWIGRGGLVLWPPRSQFSGLLFMGM